MAETFAGTTTTTSAPWDAHRQAQASFTVSNTSDGCNGLAGQLDEIAIYNRALTPTEIQALAQGGSTPRCPLPAR